MVERKSRGLLLDIGQRADIFRTGNDLVLYTFIQFSLSLKNTKKVFYKWLSLSSKGKGVNNSSALQIRHCYTSLSCAPCNYHQNLKEVMFCDWELKT